ncbi:MAG: hypothetical protein IJ772_05430 [Bacilli bacterium]|nr:hypothetical protein [Bacilli bacterium]
MSVERQTAEEEALENLGAIKSSYGLIKLFRAQLENRLLKDEENLNPSPASFTNILLENAGRLGGQAFYEQQMYKNEMNTSTAILLRSLMNKISADDLAGIYANPAMISFVLGFNYDDLVEQAIKTSDNTLVINKECEFSVSDQEIFRLDHNIKIRVTNPGSKNQNIYAMFDTSDKLNPNTSLSEVNNPYIDTQIISSNNEKVFAMIIPCRQFERNTQVIEITSDNPDFSVSYTDNLFGFELDYKKNGSSAYVYREGLPDGNNVPNGYNYAINLQLKKIQFSFNRNPNYWTPEVGDTLKLTVYTTKGSAGNFTIPDIYTQYKEITFNFRQDRNEVAQDLITKLTPHLSIKDSAATGGSDMKGFSEIRAYAINRGSNRNILTPGELKRKANEYGFSVETKINDIRNLEYRASGILTTDEDIVSSIMDTISFNLDDVPVNKEIGNRTISPKSVYNYTGSYNELIKSPTTYEEYYKKYIEKKATEYMFPYHIRVNTSSALEVTVFDMNIDNEVYNMNFVYFNNNTANQSSILNMSLYRDPITEDISKLPDAKDNRYTKGYYEFKFMVFTSQNAVENLYSNPDDPIVKYKVTISDGENTYMLDTVFTTDDINLDDCTILLHCYLKTDDAISEETKIMARDYSVVPVPYVSNPIEYYFIGGKITFSIYCIEKNLNGLSITTGYDTILTDTEKRDLYFISSVYSVDDVNLFTDISDKIDLPFDLVINQKEYQRYNSDVYKTYASDEYVIDPNTNLPATEYRKVNMNGSDLYLSVSKILHKKGSFVYVENAAMSKSNLANAISVLTGTSVEELLENDINTLAEMIEFDVGNLGNSQLVEYLNKFLGDQEYALMMKTINDIDTEIVVDSTGELVDSVTKDELQDILNSYRTKIILHRAGEINADAALAKDVNYTALIKKVPLFNRIYSLGSGYQTILNSYRALINQITKLQNVKPDGATITMGIKNTAGPGDYEIYDQNTSSWQNIDDIALSFDIGVKFQDSFINDQEAESEVIADCIRDYINNFEDVSFSINTIFEEVKKKVTSVEYMILYKINNYQANQVQSIRKKDGQSVVANKLSVKQVVDTNNSDLENEIVVFKPDITIRIIS